MALIHYFLYEIFAMNILIEFSNILVKFSHFFDNRLKNLNKKINKNLIFLVNILIYSFLFILYSYLYFK